MIRLLVADDHSILRHGLRQILTEAEGMVVAGEADTGEQALRLARETEFDVALLDISLPDLNGLEVLKVLKRERPGMAVIMLTMHGEDEFGVRAIRAGASGYLTKKSAPEQLVTAVRSVAAGRKYIGPGLAEELANSMGSDHDHPPHETLSDREFQIMRLIASGTSLSQMAATLSISPKTVSVYRARILAKMKLRNNAEITHYALKHHLVEWAAEAIGPNASLA